MIAASGKFFYKVSNDLKDEIAEWVEYFFIRNIPGRVGGKIRRMYWSGKFHYCSHFYLSTGCIIKAPENISVGKDVFIMHNSCLYANDNGIIKIGDRVGINSNVQVGAAENGEIIMGNDVLIGPNVVIRASNHRYAQRHIPINKQGHTGGKIIVEDDVWIGSNVTILPNVTIGKGAIIGAGAVVDKDVPPYTLAGGVPARVIKENCRI
jgi:galactoside O-acetyltransferase